MESPVDLTHLEDDDCEEWCPVCGLYVALRDIPAHCDSHFESQQAAEPVPDETDTVLCSACGATVALEDYESHELAHELQQEDLPAGGLGLGLGDFEFEEDASRQEVESIYFKDLRQKYGFEAQERPGACHLCKEPGHWVRDCPESAHNKAAQARIVEPRAPAILATQQPASCRRIQGGVIQQLAACLAQQNLQASMCYQAYLSGPVEHYQGEASDGGWGCGYRNLQMQASHLLMARQDAQKVLFGGCGFVPDIPALQAWLECAWAAGFDAQGAEQLEGKVQGTRKWIGTTEAATLLRYFGVRAYIIDFGAQQQQQQQEAGPGPGPSAAGHALVGSRGGPSSGGGSTAEVHPGVECDGCGCCPIVGPRYKSQVLPNYDLCGACHQAQQGSPVGPFTRMLAGRVQPGPAQQQQQQQAASGTGRPHDRLMQWVWDYFSSAPPAPPQPPSSATASVAAPSAAPPQVAQPMGAGTGGRGSSGQGTGSARPQQQQQQQQEEEEEWQAGSHCHLTGYDWVADGEEGREEGAAGVKRHKTTPAQGAGPGPPLPAAVAATAAEPGGLRLPFRHSKGQQARQGPAVAAAAPEQQQQQQQNGGAQQQRGAGGRPRWQQQPLPWQSQQGGPAVGQQGGQRGNLRVACTLLPPLYFQHEGHSRTIVGIERRVPQGKAGGARGAGDAPEYALLVLDPGCPTQPLAHALQQRQGWQRMVKRGQHTLRKAQYQLLYCASGLAEGAEYQALKIIAAAERF